jgi:ABC-type nitrate/sulfonate/bicarbonate transport system permease component
MTARSGAWRSWAVTVSIYAIILVLWEVATLRVAKPGTIWPPPTAIASEIVNERSLFLTATVATLLEAALGFLGGLVLAFGLAALSVRFRTLGGYLYRLALGLYGLPIIAIAPLLQIWLGPGISTKVVIALLSSFFPMLVNTLQGLRTADSVALEMMSTLGASTWQTLYRVRLPYALPLTIASFKIAAPSAIVGAMLAEWVGGDQGLGLTMLFAMFSFLVPRVWATLVVASLLSLLAYYGFHLLERRYASWHPALQRQRLL